MAITKKAAKKSAIAGDDEEEQGAKTAPAQLVLAAEPKTMLDGKLHVGFAVGLKTGDDPSALVVPDVAAAVDGTSPVYLTKPLTLNLDKILAYLSKKDGELAKDKLEKKYPALAKFLESTTVAIDSFYYRNGKAAVTTPPDKVAKAVARLMLMQFELNFAAADATGKAGLIKSLTGDDDLSALFEVTSLSLRVLQCDEESEETLQAYIDALAAG
jgi:hypothetical protein